MEFKDLKEAAEHIEKLEKSMFHRSDVTNQVKDVSAVSGSVGIGTVSTGDPTTNAIIEDLRTVVGELKDAVNKLIQNISNQ